MNCLLKRLNKLVIELKSTNSLKNKKQILSLYPDMAKILEYVYNPYKKYGVTSKLLKKREDLGICPEGQNAYTNIFDLLDDLYSRKLTGHDAIKSINGFITDNKEWDTLLYCIIDKDLKTRTGVSIINKVWPELIPVFKVVLARKYEDYASKIDFKKDDWYESRKLDGVRVITRIEDGDVTFYSRTGNEFSAKVTLKNVRKEIERIGIQNGVFDGELCIIDENGNEDFTSAVSQIKRKNQTISNPRYKIFDSLSLSEFDLGTSNRILLERMGNGRSSLKGSTILTYVELMKIDDTDHLKKLVTKAQNNGWEGNMIRKNVGYEGKRSNDLLKIKEFHDDEYVVKSVEVGPLRLIDKSTGLETTEEVMTNVIIEHKGYDVSVGSGFSVEQRRLFSEKPNLIIGKEITVQYFEESSNKYSELSLRFPTIKKIWLNGKRNI